MTHTSYEPQTPHEHCLAAMSRLKDDPDALFNTPMSDIGCNKELLGEIYNRTETAYGDDFCGILLTREESICIHWLLSKTLGDADVSASEVVSFLLFEVEA